MSMTGEFLRLSKVQLDRVRADHEAMFAMWFPDEDPTEGGWPPNAPDCPRATVEKTWEAIGFMLNVMATWDMIPVVSPLAGAKETDVSFDYGPITYHEPEEVAEVARVLETISREDFRKAYLPDEMHERDIYPWIWDRQEELDDNFDYIYGWFEMLVKFYQEARSHGECVLFTLM